MKSGEARRIVRQLAQSFPAPWRLVGSELMRPEGDWVQILALNASRFADQYVPRLCFEYLKIPGPATGTFLVQELRHPNGAQRWVKVSEPIDLVVEEIVRNLRPSITSPWSETELRSLLEAASSYWPHCYALCVIAAEGKDRVGAVRYLDQFDGLTREKDFPWVHARRAELVECLNLMEAPEELRSHLDVIRQEKLRLLGLVG